MYYICTQVRTKQNNPKTYYNYYQTTLNEKARNGFNMAACTSMGRHHRNVKMLLSSEAF